LYEEEDNLDKNNFNFLNKSVLNYKSRSASDLFSIKTDTPTTSTSSSSLLSSNQNDSNLIKLLDDLISMNTLTEQYKLLAAWLNDFAKRLVNLKNNNINNNNNNNQLENNDITNTIETEAGVVSSEAAALDENQLKEKRKNLAAEKRRAKILAQLNQQQKLFIKNNQDLFDETKTISTSVGNDTNLNSYLSSSSSSGGAQMDIVTNEVVAIGPHQFMQNETTQQTAANNKPKQPFHCILCQEDELISVNMPPMVLCTYVQSSKVLSKDRKRTIDYSSSSSSSSSGSNNDNWKGFDPLFLDSSLFWGIHTTSCGHVMHASCWQKYVETVKLNENRRHNRYFGFNVKKNEYLCPLCETVGNSVLPLFPDLKQLNNNNNNNNAKHEQSTPPPSTNSFKKQKLTATLTFDEWLDGLVKTLENTVKKEQKDNKDVFIINPCPLSTITKLLSDAVGSNFKTLFEFDSFITIATSNATTTTTTTNNNQLHSETLTTMETFSRTSFNIGFNYNNNLNQAAALIESDLMPIAVWSNCAYTIRSIEQLLKFDSKPLFGQFSLRQADLLANIVKQAALYGITASKHTEPVRQFCVRLLASILPYKQSTEQQHQQQQQNDLFSFDNESKNILNLDMFQLLVNLCLSMPNLYDKPNLSSVPNGGLNDFNVFKLVLQAHCFQICFVKLMNNKKNDSGGGGVLIEKMDQEEEEEEDDSLNENETKCYEFYLNIQKLVQEKQLLIDNTNNLLLSPKKVYETLKQDLMPFLRCSALFFASLTDLTPSINITSNPG